LKPRLFGMLTAYELGGFFGVLGILRG